MRRRRRLALALVLVATGIGLGGELVGADAPLKQGWWSKWQTDPATTSTTPSTVHGYVPTPPTAPPPPTGDDGGLTVANGPQGVEAVAAMFFETEEGADATLVLKAAPRHKEGVGPTTTSSIPTDVTLPPPSPVQPEEPDKDTIVLPPGGNVWACEALSSWERESNGPWSRVPTWDTEGCSPGAVTAAGTAMFWRLYADMQDIDGNYDIVLVPTGTPPAPPPPPTPVDGTTTATPPEPAEPPAQSAFMVNFASPGADTLVAEELEDPEEEPEPEPEPEPDPDDGDDGEDFGDDELIVAGPLNFPDPEARFGTTRPLRLSPPTSLAASDDRGRGPFGLPLGFPDNRRERLMAVSLLLSMAVAMWWKGGSPTRTPRLIGAAAGRSTSSAPAPPSLRGIGRFARERLGRPRRL